MTLQTEFESRRGKAYLEILSEIQAITRDVVMPIEGLDLRDVVTVLASGLDYRLQMAEPSPLRSGLMRAFNSMSINEFGFNLSDPVVAQMLDLGVAANLIDVNERLWFYAIATKQVPTYPNVQLIDVVKYFNHELIDGEWHELPETDGRTLALQLNTRTPEVTHIVVQMQDLSGEWEHATALHGIQSAKPYSAPLPYYGQARKVRWKCEYALNGSVAVL